MTQQYRFKTFEEFEKQGYHMDEFVPIHWHENMQEYLGADIPKDAEKAAKQGKDFHFAGWAFSNTDYIEIELDYNGITEITKNLKIPLKQEKMSVNKPQVAEFESSLKEEFVFMDKAISILEIGMKVKNNVILYGPGGHGKSELTMAFFEERDIEPFVVTMGTGMNTDRLFGGVDISQFAPGGKGKIEYLVENSFMNHEYVIFEEMMDAPDFILEQLKDILSSGVFRNGSQVFPIKTKFIVCCTNKTRDEFAKNSSLRALMERFPLELNVIWDNYNEIAYNTLLEAKFGEGTIDPIIPFLLQEYHKNSITISPRIAIVANNVYEKCGPEALMFIAEFSKKPALISSTLKKYEATIKFRQLSVELEEIITKVRECKMSSTAEVKDFKHQMEKFDSKLTEIQMLTVNEDFVAVHTNLVKKAKEIYKSLSKKEAVVSFVMEDEEL